MLAAVVVVLAGRGAAVATFPGVGVGHLELIDG
jgi:hypothetical protein